MISRLDIKLRAKQQLSKQYWPCVGWLFLLSLISALLPSVVSGSNINTPFFVIGNGPFYYVPPTFTLSIVLGFVLSILITAACTVGISYFGALAYRGESVGANQAFIGFKKPLRSLGGLLWMQLWIFLWSLLFIIPGLIKSYAYSMTPYLLADRDDISATDALKLSMEMTHGYKMDLFIAHLSFIGWFLLVGLTLGIVGIFYVIPYFVITMGGYYEELKLRHQDKTAYQTI
ncbi:MAG: DUF975 family protein [Christensenellales bacterium]